MSASPFAVDDPSRDPLHILRSTAAVMRSGSFVTIDMEAMERVAADLVSRHPDSSWDADLHTFGPGTDEQQAMWIFVLDALNFCFWGQGTDPDIRWRVEHQGALTDGYMALVAALKRGIDEDVPLHDAQWLSAITREEVHDLLRPAGGHPRIPLFAERIRHLRELGQGMLALRSATPATDLIAGATGSAIALVQEVVSRFPSFNDVATWPHAETGLPGNEVRFHKRAQILVGDLSGALGGTALGAFADLDRLTAFADYKVPQMLRALGIIRYREDLADRIHRREIIPAGSREEIEIRAGTIWGCELLHLALAGRGRNMTAHEIDWLLWEQGQSLPPDTDPYHRTPTVYY